MRTSARTLAAVLSAASLFSPRATAQTYTDCNPTKSKCPADPALGKSVSINFASGSCNQFTPSGASISYGENGVSFTVAKSGDAPQLTSEWYIMFGKVEVELKAAPGAGIVSSFVLQSDDLDEIDWEWLGADSTEVQTNYFGKGQTGTYNRGAFHPNPGNQADFHNYTVDWTAEQVEWKIDGNTVRVLTTADAVNSGNSYPQTPMQIKVGAWSGGDSSNSQGTIEWARGPTDYSSGPFTMQVKSITVTDYSTGTQYQYSDMSGTWQSIVAVGGSVSPGSSSTVASAAPAVTSSSSGQPIPFQGSSGASTVTRPSVYPWVPGATTLSTVTNPYTAYPGLPSGWTVTTSGKVIPPSSASSTHHPASSSPHAPQSASSAGCETVTTYDQQGFTTVVTQAAGHPTSSKAYDSRGFLVSAGGQSPAPSASPALANAQLDRAGSIPATAGASATAAPASNLSTRAMLASSLVVAWPFFTAALLLL